MLPCDGVVKLQPLRAEQLARYAQFRGKPLALLVSVLGIPQNGEAHMGTMDPELMGSSGKGLKRKFT